MLMCGDIFIGNDIPVYTFTTPIFKHRHPRFDQGDLHRLSTVIPGLTGDLRTTVSFPRP